MAKIVMTVELDYDPEIIRCDSPESIEWFRRLLFAGPGTLYSEEIKGNVGSLQVLDVVSGWPPAS